MPISQLEEKLGLSISCRKYLTICFTLHSFLKLVCLFFLEGNKRENVAAKIGHESFFFKCKIYMCVHIDINMWCWFIRDTQAFVWSLCRHSYLTCDLAKTSSDPPPRWQSNKVSLCRKHRLTYLNVLCRKNTILWYNKWKASRCVISSSYRLNMYIQRVVRTDLTEMYH